MTENENPGPGQAFVGGESTPSRRWEVLVNPKGIYLVTCYALAPNGLWVQESAAWQWTYLDGALEHIRKRETERGGQQ
jgi:hypothetical protein